MITVNVNKAKSIAHTIRRDLREVEFKPYDEIISKQIPGIESSDAEVERQKIRDKYSDMQTKIDVSKTAEQIKSALGL